MTVPDLIPGWRTTKSCDVRHSQVRNTLQAGKRCTDAMARMMIDDLLSQWRTDAADNQLFSASRVQDFLFELWGATEGRARELVEEWLPVTVHRELFSVEELDGLFAELEALVPSR